MRGLLARWPWLRRFVPFAAIGAALTGLNLALLALLTQVANWPYLLACTLNFVLFNFIGYRLNKAISFRLGGAIVWSEVARWFSVKGASLALNLGTMALLVEVLGLHVLVASLLISVALAPMNFLAHCLYTFARGASAGGVGGAGVAAGGSGPSGEPGPGPGQALRVLQVSAFYPRHGGGIEVVAGELAAQLARSGVELAWMAGGPAPEWPGPQDFSGVRTVPARGIDLLERVLGLPAPLWGPGSLAALWREVGRAQLVHLHDALYQPTLAAFFFARLRGRPVVLTQHVGDIRFHSRLASATLWALNRSLVPAVMRGCEQVAFVGEPVRAQFVPRLAGRARRPALLVPNGVDHETFSPVPASPPTSPLLPSSPSSPSSPSPSASPAPREGPLRALFVGRFVQKKGLALLREAVPDAGWPHWCFVGRGPLSPAQWPSVPGVEIELRGVQPPEQVAQAMREADLLVLPSTGEGFPLVVQEALACGTPVLVSQEVAEAFPVTDARCVHAVELRGSAPAAALHEALQTLARDPQGLRAARAAAAALAAQWSWPACAATYLQVYRELAGPEGAAPAASAPV